MEQRSPYPTLPNQQTYPTAGQTVNGLVRPWSCGFRVSSMRDGRMMIEDAFLIEPTEARAVQQEADSRYYAFKAALVQQLQALPQAEPLRQASAVTARYLRAADSYRESLAALERDDSLDGLPERVQRITNLKAALPELAKQAQAHRRAEEALAHQYSHAAGALISRARLKAQDEPRQALENRDLPLFERAVAARLLVMLEDGHIDKVMAHAPLSPLPPAEPMPAVPVGIIAIDQKVTDPFTRPRPPALPAVPGPGFMPVGTVGPGVAQGVAAAVQESAGLPSAAGAPGASGATGGAL